MMQEFDLRALLNLGEVGPAAPDTGQEVAPYDYDKDIEKVRELYVDLLNKYGISDGEVIEETPHFFRPKTRSRFSFFRITSKRRCPTITEVLSEGAYSLEFYSFEHTERVTKPYDPETLTEIFPNDVVDLDINMRMPSTNPLEIGHRTFHIYNKEIDCYVANYPENLGIPVTLDVLESRRHKATPEELEMLLLLHPLLETRYQQLRPSLPAPKEQLPSPRFGFLRRLWGANPVSSK